MGGKEAEEKENEEEEGNLYHSNVCAPPKLTLKRNPRCNSIKKWGIKGGG